MSMLKIVINNDGSVRLIDFPNYIVKGSYGVDTAIYVAFAEQNINDGTFTALAEFILPDGSHQNLPLTHTITTDNLQWKYEYLNAAITAFSGVLLCSIRVSSNTGSNVLYSYNTKITINPSTLTPDEEAVTNITQAQYTVLYDAVESALESLGAYDTDINNAIATIDSKLDKITNAGTYVYAHTGSTQTQIDCVYSVLANAVVRRNADGQVYVPNTPTNNSHATSKYYVDNLVSTLKANAYQSVDLTTYPTLADFLESTGEEGYIYLYPTDTSDLTKPKYEYIYESDAWVLVGTTELDLTNYYSKSEIQGINNQLLASAYDNTSTYSIGDFVIYNNTLYRCKTNVSTAENFDSSKWTSVKVSDYIGQFESSLANTNDSVSVKFNQDTSTLLGDGAYEMVFVGTTSNLPYTYSLGIVRLGYYLNAYTPGTIVIPFESGLIPLTFTRASSSPYVWSVKFSGFLPNVSTGDVLGTLYFRSVK